MQLLVECKLWTNLVVSFKHKLKPKARFYQILFKIIGGKWHRGTLKEGCNIRDTLYIYYIVLTLWDTDFVTF